MRTHVFIQARLGSTRLPGKVMMDLAGHPVLWHDLQRIRAAKTVSDVIVATTVDPSDDRIASACDEWGTKAHRGSVEDVLDRFHGAAKRFGSDVIVRVTSDCPLIDPHVIDLTVRALKNHDYVTNVFDRNFPRGMDAEVFTRAALDRAHREATKPFDREHVTPYIREHTDLFKTANVDMPDAYHFPQFRLTLDTPEDYALFRAIYDQFYREGELIRVPEVLRWLAQHPEIAALNAKVYQKPDPKH
jgi:spore coat polysaccharide biosynthesis protein SpsF